MRVVFHPGPNKTGTTSIQRHLLKAFGSETPGPIWYPSQGITASSPGHVPLILALRRNMGSGLDMIRDWIRHSQQNGVDTLIISAEDFCKFDAETLVQVGNVIRPVSLELVITLTNVRSQSVSWFQEQIKHGQTRDFGSKLALKKVRQTPVLRPNIVSFIRDAVAPEKTTVVIGDKSAPSDQLIRDFLSGAGLPPISDSDPAPVTVNRSHGLIEIEVIRHLNMAIKSLEEKGVDAELPLLRRRLVQTMTTDNWRRLFPKLPLTVPEGWNQILEKKADTMFSDLQQLQSSGKITIIGDPEHVRA